MLTCPFPLRTLPNKTLFLYFLINFSLLIHPGSNQLCAKTETVTANFSLSSTGPICPGERIFFQNLSVGATDFTWKVDGFAFSIARDTSFEFFTPGSFNITLVARDSNCVDSLHRTIEVTSPPLFSFMIVPQTCPGDSDGSIDLSLTGGSPPFVIQWTSGDTTEDLSGLDSGRYILTLRDSAGCVWRDTADVPSRGGITADFDIDQLGAFVRLSDLTAPTPTEWRWDMGDSTVYSVQHPTHTYAVNGQYQICLLAKDSIGCRDSLCENISVTSTLLEKTQQKPLRIFYDPGTSTLFLHLENHRDITGRLQVATLAGKVVARKYLSPGTADIRINLSRINSGIYLVLLESGREVYSGRFLKSF